MSRFKASPIPLSGSTQDLAAAVEREFELLGSQLWDGLPFFVRTKAEAAAGVTPVNYAYAPGVVDRYGTNTTPGTTNMLSAFTNALNVAVQAGGGEVSFLPGVDYFLGTISVATTTLLSVSGLSNVTIRGNGARLVTNTTVQDASNIPVWFALTNPNRVVIENLRHYDSGTNLAVDFQGPRCWSFTATGSTDCGQITFINCYFNKVVDHCRCYYTSGTARVKGIQFVNHVVDTCYYGPSFQEQGDDVYGDITTINCIRSYYLYGVTGHDVRLNVHHDGVARAGNGCIVIKRYDFDTLSHRIRANFHGAVPHATLIDFEIQSSFTAGFQGITNVPTSGITGGSLYTNGTYVNVPLTGGTGSGATADITVASGAVKYLRIVKPGVGYLSTDTISAAAANIGGTGSGFSATVQVGGIVQDVDIDCHLSDDIEPGGASQSIVGFRSYNAGGTVNATTTDFWDGISIRGNFGAWNPYQNYSPIFIGSVQQRQGRLSLSETLFSNFIGYPQAYGPGFLVQGSESEEIYTEAGDITATPLFIDLQRYDGTLWALKVKIYAEADYTIGSTNQSYYEYTLLGIKTAGATPVIESSSQDIAHTSGTASVPTISATGNGIQIAMTIYNGANASMRVKVEHMSKFL